jgi:hypothetical protein
MTTDGTSFQDLQPQDERAYAASRRNDTGWPNNSTQ